ncbi:MAG: hypothetical protein L0G87_01490 [Renibacterium salmoninarum]|nr:hypothetical protein [Renibacterium salmoninarum]
MRTYTITDNLVDHVAVEVTDIVEAITPWFPGAPQDVLDAIEDIAKLAARGEYLGEHEAMLGITVKVN